MCNYKFIFFVLLPGCLLWAAACGNTAAVAAAAADGALIRPSGTLYVANGEGFVAHLEMPKSFGAIEQCWYKFRDEDYVLLPLNASEAHTTARNEDVLPFAVNVCGIRVNRLSTGSAAAWSLRVTSVHGEAASDSVTVSILPAPKVHFDTQALMEVGKGTIRCTKHDSYTKLCRIVDTATQTVWQQCELYTTIRHSNQTFECHTYNWGRLGESYERISVQIKEPILYTTPSVTSNASSIVLRCLYSEVTTHSCHAEMPNGGHNGLFIMDGLYNGRYSTYDTLSTRSRCSLEIPKPLASGDIGLWRIMNYDSGTPAGCIFYVGRDKRAIIEDEIAKLSARPQTVQAYHTDSELKELQCAVPFVIEDCYLRDPNHTVYFPDLLKFQRYRLFGKCSFDNVPLIAGIWLCGARGRDYDHEVLQRIEVVVKPRGGEALTSWVRAKRGGSVELMCRAPFDEPISHCAFINPAGDVFLVGTVNSIKTAGHVRYHGRGIQIGECGVRISDLIADDFGAWKCQFVITAGNLKSTFAMQLADASAGGTAHASSVGLGVGVSVVVVLLMAVVVGTIVYRRRNLRARHNFVIEEHVDAAATTSETATTQF